MDYQTASPVSTWFCCVGMMFDQSEFEAMKRREDCKAHQLKMKSLGMCDVKTRRQRVMRSVHILFAIIFCSLHLSINAQPNVAPKLPFNFAPACHHDHDHDNDNDNDPTSSIVATTPATPTPNHTYSSTLLLFFQGLPSPSPSSCRCDVSSAGALHLTCLHSGGDPGVKVTRDNVTSEAAGGCPQMRTTPRFWNGSAEDPLTITLTGGPQAGGFLLLVLQGTDDMKLKCREVAQPTDSPSSDTTTPSADSQSGTTGDGGADQPSTSSSSPPPLTPTTSTSSSSSNNQLTRGGDNNKATSTGIPDDNNSSQYTVSQAGGRSGSEKGGHGGRGDGDPHTTEHYGDDKDLMGYPALGLGVALMIIAIIVILVVVVRQRRRKKSNDLEQTTGGVTHRQPSSSSSRRSRTKSSKVTTTTTTGSSRDSLVNDHHNYEEMSDDGLGGRPSQADRKGSSLSRPPTIYSHLNPNASPPPHAALSEEDDYNHLDLARAQRLPGEEVIRGPAPKTTTTTTNTNTNTAFRSEVGEDDYMAVNDEDEREVEASPEGDIYEAVDGDPERTPLCPRRTVDGDGVSDQVYTDCRSWEDGKVRAGTGNNPGPPSKGGGVENRPTLPTSPPPPPPQGAQGLQRSNSRSVDSLVRAKFQGRAQHAAHSRSESQDLQQQQQQQKQQKQQKQHSLCEERDLFLQNFHQNHQVGTSSDRPQPDAQYTDVVLDVDPPPPATREESSSPGPQPPGQTSPQVPDPPGPDQVMLRRKSRRSRRKGADGRPVSMVEHLQELNTELQELETAVRHSMEIKEDELVMMDNILYGTLPRNLSLPTTEL